MQKSYISVKIYDKIKSTIKKGGTANVFDRLPYAHPALTGWF